MKKLYQKMMNALAKVMCFKHIVLHRIASEKKNQLRSGFALDRLKRNNAPRLYVIGKSWGKKNLKNSQCRENTSLCHEC